MSLLEIKNLYAKTENTSILHGTNLAINTGEVVALMGPNGSGKSTLAHVLMGHPLYEVTQGGVVYRGQDLLTLKPEQRAARGIFLSFQYPQEIAGVTVGNFLRLAYNATHREPLGVAAFLVLLRQKMDMLRMPHDFMTRSVNEGFSGGEKKRGEMLQLAVLEPRLAILDETDSGLDVDALRIVGQAVTTMQRQNEKMSVLLITHYQRILKYIPADRVAVMKKGKVVAQGQAELIEQVERDGFGSL